MLDVAEKKKKKKKRKKEKKALNNANTLIENILFNL